MRFRLPPLAVLPPAVLILAALLPAAISPCATAQTAPELQHPQDPRHYDATRTGEVVDLGPLWLFHEGDDPAFAAKDFDDSKWPVITTNKRMASQGYPDLNQIWYRVHVRVSPASDRLVVGITSFFGSYEIFVNGVRIEGGRKLLRPGDLIRMGHSNFTVRTG